MSIVAAWAPGSAEMDRTSYSDPATVTLVNECTVPVRVDADQRPDLADRYDLGGLPTTAFLTGDGDVVGGGTFVSPERLRAALARIGGAMESLRTGRLAESPCATTASPGAANTADTAVLDVVFASFDDEHGGFGIAPKFPLTAPIWLAIDLYVEQREPQMLDRSVRTLEAMGWGPLYDEEDGGFFRCATAADWSAPEPQKLLTTNAALLELYLHAGEVLRQDRWFERARAVASYLDHSLSANGSWRSSDAGGTSATLTDGNALAASAALHAAAVFQDDALGKKAIDALERVLLSSYKPGEGVAHYAKGVRGLLTDQVAMATANLDAWESTGNIVYRMMAEELAHYALRTMWDPDGGGLLDRDLAADPTEPLPRTAKPFVLNCDAAVLLHRLAQAANEEMFEARAHQMLDAIGPVASAAGPLGAHYLIARRAVLR